jgi:hypothetical protein
MGSISIWSSIASITVVCPGMDQVIGIGQLGISSHRSNSTGKNLVHAGAYHGYAGYAAPYAYAAHGIAPAAYAAAAPVAVAAAPAAYAAAPVAVAHAGLGLPEARTYALPPVRQVQEAPIVEQIVEPVEQWGYKVAY